MAGAPEVDTSDGRAPELVWATMHGLVEDVTKWDMEISFGDASYIIYKYLDLVIGIPKEIDYAEIDRLCTVYPNITRERIIAAKWCKNKSIIAVDGDEGILPTYDKTINRGQMATYLQGMYFLSINKE